MEGGSGAGALRRDGKELRRPLVYQKEQERQARGRARLPREGQILETPGCSTEQSPWEGQA